MPVSTTFKDYYGILAINKSATDDDIKAAYKALALQWHPDRHSKRKEEAGRKFIEINEAYKFLMDKGRREWYDNFPATGDKDRGRPTTPNKQQAPPSKPSAGEGLHVPPATPHRAKSESGVRNPPPEPPSPQPEKSRARAKSTGDGNDRNVEPEVDLRDFIRRMSKQDKPPNSKEPSLKSHNATVYDASDSDEPSVQTTGMQLHTTTVITTGVPSEWIFPLPLTLEELSEGTAHRYRITRHLLSGKKKNIMVDIDVAPGWKKGTKIRFSGAGNERQGGAPQDVVFIVEEIPHERFMRQGSALVARVQITLLEALVGEGRSVFLTGLDGKELEICVPPGIIKPGDECRIEGAGMPIRKQGKIIGTGDMVIRWEISFPDKLSKKQMKELRKTLESD
ncbi:DnaJ-domain-containing protein [Ramaria rubella]|nr:DnaJ-domain-containing protein [Ramaria rubella]